MHHAPIRLRDILRDIADGRQSARETVEAAFRRIEAVDGEIGAFVHVADRETTVRQADRAGPLAGVPLAFKDIFDTADMPTGYGSPIHAGFRPASDAALVAMARARGATIVGKSVTTEFAFLTPAQTRNPTDLRHTPGGSSSGSAAAVASGMAAGAFGSQTAGSVIRPAAFCGIAGYKPSFRLLPTAGMKTFAWTLDTVGLFAASVPDVALLADLVSGRALRVRETPDAAALRIGVYRSRIDGELEPSMVNAVERARRVVESAGARTVDLEESDELAAGRSAQTRIQLHEGAIALAHERRLHEASLSEALRDALAEGAAIEPELYDDARRTARRARRAVAPFFSDVDAILAPSALGAAPGSIATTGDPAMNRLWTVTGNPVVNVPGLRDDAGLPLGLSVIGRFGSDERTLGIAAHLETLLQESA